MTAASDLRRTDWRFLLPPPAEAAFRHVVLLGGPPTLPDLVLRLGLARRVSREIPPKDSADALVLLDGAEVDLSKASGCLSPGGAVYWEVQRRWTSFFRTTPRAIRRRLLEAGLTPLALHWARPNFGRAAMYLPIGPRGVFPWYVETLLEPGTLPRRAARLLLGRLVRRGGAWSYRLLPRFAVTAISGPAGHRSLPPGTLTAFGTDSEAGSAPFVLLRGTDSYRRVIVFPFSANARDPAVVIKLWRLPDRNANAETEQVVLGQIRSRLDAAIGRTLPEPLGTIRCGETVAGIESYAPGPSLTSFTNAWGRPLRGKLQDLTLVFDWIAEFHRQAQVSRKPWDGVAAQQWIEEPLANHRSAFGVRPDEERLFAAVRQRARALFGMPLPIVWAHPDLTGANIHIQDRRITVIDWSGTVPRLPLYDLLYFVMLWAAGMERDQSMDARLPRFRRVFILREATDIVTGELRESIRRYLKSVEIDSRFLPVLLTMAWVVRSLECDERERAVARGEPGANPHPGESYVEYVHLLAEETDTLFSESPSLWWMT